MNTSGINSFIFTLTNEAQMLLLYQEREIYVYKRPSIVASQPVFICLKSNLSPERNYLINLLILISFTWRESRSILSNFKASERCWNMSCHDHLSLISVNRLLALLTVNFLGYNSYHFCICQTIQWYRRRSCHPGKDHSLQKRMFHRRLELNLQEKQNSNHASKLPPLVFCRLLLTYLFGYYIILLVML